MKCPKCGFNSFEFYDSCKKCSSDLTGYKQTYSITSIVLPQEAKEKLAAEFRSADGTVDPASDTTETHDDIFSFNLPDDSPSTPDHQNNEPFNFDDSSPSKNQSISSKSEDDVFGDLLESTSQADESPFAAAMEDDTPTVAMATDAASGSGELDLESFSWDYKPATATDDTEATDDFDSLFGETKVENKSS